MSLFSSTWGTSYLPPSLLPSLLSLLLCSFPSPAPPSSHNAASSLNSKRRSARFFLLPVMERPRSLSSILSIGGLGEEGEKTERQTRMSKDGSFSYEDLFSVSLVMNGTFLLSDRTHQEHTERLCNIGKWAVEWLSFLSFSLSLSLFVPSSS